MRNILLFLLLLVFSPLGAKVVGPAAAATAPQVFDAIPGTLIKQGRIVWSCLPEMGPTLVCAPIPIDAFCQIERREFDKGILACVKPLMAEYDQVQES